MASHILPFLLLVTLAIADFLRPALHITPFNKAWLNDPNGLFRDADGLWHVYYQYDQNVNAFNRKDWGHATSPDLWTWTHHALAIEHDDTWGIWSGSAVIDVNNTSGFFPQGQTNGVVAIYTQSHLTENWEEQAIAYSLDGGYTFQKYDQNPVLAINSAEFRDPKVIWHEKTQKWVMAVAYAADRVIGLYSSHDLKAWTHESNFSNPNLSGSNFECPNMVPIPYVDADDKPLVEGSNGDNYILLASSGGGSPLYNGDGSVTRYFPGTFNGTHFTAVDDRADRVVDFGPDNYAVAAFFGLPDNQSMVNIGWATNLAYAGGQPSGDREGWRGILTSVRSARLVKTADGEIRYHSAPLGLRSVKKTPLKHLTLTTDSSNSISYSSIGSGAVHLNAQVDLVLGAQKLAFKPGVALDLVFTASKSGEYVYCMLAFNNASATTAAPSFFCDRSAALNGWTDGQSWSTMQVQSIPAYDASISSWNVTMIMDHSILEVYLNGGLAAGTMTVFPKEAMDRVTVRTRGIQDRVKVQVAVEGLSV